MIRTSWHGAAVVVLGIVALAGCADYVGDDVRSGAAAPGAAVEAAIGGASTSTTTPPAPVDPRTLEVGACFDDVEVAADQPPPGPAGVEAGQPVVPRTCVEEHRYELYAREALAAADAPWPGADAIAEQADGYCTASFESFVGAAWAESTLDYAAQVPDEARWAAGERNVSCALFDLELGPLEGSMAGTGR